jgi:hypothetical protein
MLSAGIIFGTAICSVMIFAVNYIGALDLEQRSAIVEKEMHGVLEQDESAYIYIDRTNFPLGDYVLYNRTAKVMYFAGLLSEEQIRMRIDPARPPEILGRLKVYGDTAWSVSRTAPEVDVEKIQELYQGHLRYLIFYRFTEGVKVQIKNKIKGYNLTYESENWLVYDLASG